MGYFMYGRFGTGDHGREDWIRGTCALFPGQVDILTSNLEDDFRFGLGAVAGLFHERNMLKHNRCLLPYPIHRMKGIVWSWPVGRIPKKLNGFEKIVVPDRRSLTLLRDAGIEKKIRLGPDLSFLVSRRIRPLDGAFRRDTVGLCLGRSDLSYATIRQLICYILMETTFEIAIIPYHSKDIPMLTVLARLYRDCGRVFFRPDGDSETLRGDISLCRCVVGMGGGIAAWSCGVPALCLGADARSVGLAMDLFGSWQETVVPLQTLRTEGALVNRFKLFLRRENHLRHQLEIAVPQRREFARQWRM